MKPDLKDKLEAIPALPGIYQFKDSKGKIIYVGKAKDLRSRIRSYFQSNLDSPKTKALVSKIADIETIITDNEIEALVLENNLIKLHKPRYNVNLKDDKSYPYIRVTKEPYPQIFSTRQIVRDGSLYFGPYTDVKNMKASLRMINQTFKIRSCKYYIDDEVIKKGKIKVCLDYHIKKCDGPCEGLVSEKEYNKMVQEVIKVLRGKTASLISELKEQMEEEAKKLNFEKASEIRDKLRRLEIYSAKQKVVSNDFEDRDVISVAVEDKDVAATVLNIRDGKLVGKRQLKLSSTLNDSLNKIYNAVIKFYYGEFAEIPKEILLEVEPEDAGALLKWLNQRSARKTKFVIPKKSSNALSLLKMSKQNALLLLKDIQIQRMKREGTLPHVLTSLKRDLYLKNIPKRIECFDISNIQGSDTVASMVVFENAKPKKSKYRKYIIKSVEGPDDFASMREVIERRYSKLKESGEPLPDLIMVDGGKGQLSSAVSVLKDLGFKKFEIIGLAKRLEEIFLPNSPDSITIPKTSSSLKLLQKIRDEAHRFAITFHRQRRSKRTLTTELTEIKGIGEKAAEKLLKHFRSINEIKSAEKEELAKVIGQAKAELVYKFYH